MIFAFIGGGLVFSETVSVVVVEVGIPEDAPTVDSSSIWESGLMDAFYEHGHIVSNAAMLRLNADHTAPVLSEELVNIDEVKEGGSAYYVLAVLNYIGIKEPTSRPTSISLRLVQLYPDKVLYETQIDGNGLQTQNDELERAMNAAETMIPYLKK
jgi:hypothetical protein